MVKYCDVIFIDNPKKRYVNMSLKYERYGLCPGDAQALRDIEKSIGQTLPCQEKIIGLTFGFKKEGEKVVELGLSNCGLENLPQSIENLKSLEKLDLIGNELKTLPAFVGMLESLKVLALERNQLVSIPESIGNLKSLKILDLGNNELKKLPESIGNLESLESLVLWKNHLTSLPESISNLKSLERIYLWNNKLKNLQESFGKLKSLQTLDLSFNNITILPESFGGLISLQRLLLGKNQLKYLPKSFGNLSNLQELKLFNNQIQTLPESFKKLKLLKEIDLRDNKLTIDEKIQINWYYWVLEPKQAKTLEELESLISFPIPRVYEEREFGVQVEDVNIVRLGLFECGLKDLPESIGNLSSLRWLSLKKNNLTKLPISFQNLLSLRSLDLSENGLKILSENFIEIIAHVKSLRELNLSKNHLNLLPRKFGDLNSLHKINFSNNLLVTFPDSFDKLLSLEELNLENNKISIFPQVFLNLYSIQKLVLNSNLLKSIPQSIESLKVLEELHLRNNEFITLPYAIWILKRLKILEMDGNPLIKESKKILKRDIYTIREFCRQRANINVFISYAVVDFEIFYIDKISEYLEKQEEIYQVYYCGEDLRGNIDDFMNETVPKCQIIIFFASTKSVYNSVDCKHELELAQNHKILTIPIKGKGIKWGELDNVNLSRELGFKFNKEYFDAFCERLYNVLKDYKRNFNLFKPDEARIDAQKFNIRNTTNHLLDSKMFKDILKKNLPQFEALFQELNSKQITPIDYFSKCAQIMYTNSQVLNPTDIK